MREIEKVEPVQHAEAATTGSEPTGNIVEPRLQDGSADSGIAEWPKLEEPTLVHWCSPHIDVLVEVRPGDDITAALIAAAKDEIALFAPVNVEEFDVTIEPSTDC